MDVFADLPNVTSNAPGVTVDNQAAPDLFADLPSAQHAAPGIDWSNVKSSADVQKVLDGLPDAEAKTAALRDWAKQQVQGQVDQSGFAPHGSPAQWLPGSGLLDQLGAVVGAGIDKLKNGTNFGDAYAQERALQHARDDYASENDSTLRKVANAAGGLAVGMKLPGLDLFPAAALTGKVANTVATGAGYGAVQGAGEGDTPEEMLKDAGWGALGGGGTGALLYPVAAGAGNTVEYAANALKPLPPELADIGRGAAQRLVKGLEDDKLDPATFAQKAQTMGPEAMPADMGENMLLYTNAIANRLGKGMTDTVEKLNLRDDAAEGRLNAAIDPALGQSQNMVRLPLQMTEAANQQAAPGYRAFEQQDIPMTQELADALREADAWGALRPAIQMARGQSLMPRAINRLEPDPMSPMTGLPRQVTDLVPTGRELDYVKRALDERANDAFAAGQSHKGDLINQTAARLRNEIDRITNPQDPGNSAYAQGRRASQIGQQFEQGVREGKGTFSNPKTHNPDLVEYQLDPRRPGYSGPYEQGYRAAARSDLADMANDARSQFGPTGDRALRQGLWSNNAQRKIDMLASSPQAAQTLKDRVDTESTFARTRNEVIANSATAKRTAAQKLFPSTQEKDPVSGHLTSTMSGLAIAGLKKLANAATAGAINRHLDAMAEGAAKFLTSTGADRDTYFNALQQYAQSRGLSAAQAKAVRDAVSDAAKPLEVLAARKVTQQ